MPDPLAPSQLLGDEALERLWSAPPAEPFALPRPGPVSRTAAAALVTLLHAAFGLGLLALAGLLGSPGRALLVVVPVVGLAMATGHARTSALALGGGLLEELPRLHRTALLTTVLLVSTGPVGGLAGAAVAYLCVVAAGSVAHLTAGALGRSVLAPERCLLIGSADRREAFIRTLLTAPGHRAVLAGAVGLEDVGRGDGPLPTIEELIERHRATRVVVLEGTDPARAAQTARRARNAGVRLTVAQEAIESLGPPGLVEHVGSAVLLSHPAAPTATGAMTGKRALDLVGAGLALVALAPLMLLAALAIRLDSRGPAVFWQERIGLGGRRFRIAKFRTMCDDAEQQKDGLRPHNEAGAGMFKMAADPRVTRVGRLLRRTSMDELPQLINVLRGEMSLVGPRPLVTEEDALIGGWHRDRLHLKPGMTGRWQILGSTRVPLHEMVRLDQQYVASWSVWLDVRILLRTAALVLRCRGL